MNELNAVHVRTCVLKVLYNHFLDKKMEIALVLLPLILTSATAYCVSGNPGCELNDTDNGNLAMS